MKLRRIGSSALAFSKSMILAVLQSTQLIICEITRFARILVELMGSNRRPLECHSNLIRDENLDAPSKPNKTKPQALRSLSGLGACRFTYTDKRRTCTMFLKDLTEGELNSIQASPHGHLITRFARAKTSGGIVRLRALAVFKLISNSNFVGCSTGMSAGFVPFRILSTIHATRLEASTWSGP